MFERLRRGFFVGVALLFMLCLGFATPALASPEDGYNPNDAKLTAVIIAPTGADVSGDKFVFHFAGGGTAKEMTGPTVNDQPTTIVKAGGVEQDTTTIKDGDVVPTIGNDKGDVELRDTTLTEINDTNSLTNGDQLRQAVVEKSIASIFNGVTFPHAGVYTYEVTEKAPEPDTNKNYVIASQAKYRLRVYVINAKTGAQSESGDESLEISHVTIERILDDYGNEASGKTDPTYPKTDENGKITSTPNAQGLVGDESGHNVPGFTFSHDYITIGSLQVKKLYDGVYGDRTKLSTVELAVHNSTAVNASVIGDALTYKIEGGGNDLTEGYTVYDEQEQEHMVKFGQDGWCYITAGLKEGSSIRITGEFGPNGETLTTNGLFQGQTYYVLEGSPIDYRPTGYVYEGTGAVDPRVDANGMTRIDWDDDPVQITDNLKGSKVYTDNRGELPPFALLVTDNTTGNATTIFVVNDLDTNKVSNTGILVDNLPYILMIGVPLVVFAGMFVAKRRGNAA